MKVSAVIKIIIWSFVLIFLVGILFAGLSNTFNILPISIKSFVDNNNKNYENAEGSVEVSGINEIVIEWLSGYCNIIEYDGENIVFEEESTKTIDEKDQMQYYVEGDRLYIRYYKPKVYFGITNVMMKKNLTVKIPKEHKLNNLDIDFVSSGLEINNIYAETCNLEGVSQSLDINNSTFGKIDIETVTGKINLNNIEAKKVDIESVSGKIEIEGIFETIKGSSVTGGFKVKTANAPNKVDIETVNGDISLTIPENEGFIASYSTLIGDFSCEFLTTNKGESAVYKDASADYNFETVNGNIKILKG